MKSIYKYIFSLPLGLMLFGMQSCSDDKTEDESGPRPVILKAEVFTAGNVQAPLGAADRASESTC